MPSFNISDEDRELIIRAVEAARNHPKLIDGIWWVWDFGRRGYVSTGQTGSITGDIGGDKNYYYTQVTPKDEWIIEHNLGKYPSVTVVSSAGEEIYCDKKFLSAGGSVPPIEALRYAGVDMEKPDAVKDALQVFADTTTNQNLMMIPLSEMPGSWDKTIIFDTPPQNL